MRHKRMIGIVAGRDILAHQTGHRIRHAMRQMNAGIAEPNARIRRRQHHLGARLVVGRVRHRAAQILRHHAQRFQTPDVADRVRSLIGRAQNGPIRPRPLGHTESR